MRFLLARSALVVIALFAVNCAPTLYHAYEGAPKDMSELAMLTPLSSASGGVFVSKINGAPVAAGKGSSKMAVLPGPSEIDVGFGYVVTTVFNKQRSTTGSISIDLKAGHLYKIGAAWGPGLEGKKNPELYCTEYGKKCSTNCWYIGIIDITGSEPELVAAKTFLREDPEQDVWQMGIFYY